jgi:secondary thiamine-phosphate synthase enzyme
MPTAWNSEFLVRTKGKGTYEITDRVSEVVRKSRIQAGLATVFLRHTSASLILFENADGTARRDLEKYFDRLVPEDDENFTHTMEGSDDMPSHLRMVLTRSSESIPVSRGELLLGAWQGIFLFEHRQAAHERRVVVNVLGDAPSV